MYGIMSACGSRYLSHSYGFSEYVMQRWDSRTGTPAIKSTAHEIDTLLQWAIVAFNDYSLIVFEFTKEQEAELIIRRLNDY